MAAKIKIPYRDIIDEVIDSQSSERYAELTEEEKERETAEVLSVLDKRLDEHFSLIFASFTIEQPKTYGESIDHEEAVEAFKEQYRKRRFLFSVMNCRTKDGRAPAVPAKDFVVNETKFEYEVSNEICERAAKQLTDKLFSKSESELEKAGVRLRGTWFVKHIKALNKALQK